MVQKHLLVFSILITVISLFQCSKKMLPENNESLVISEPILPLSNLNLNVKVSRDELNETLNYLVNNLFNDGFTMEDDYKIHTRISGPVDMQALKNTIITTIPLQLEIIPGGFFGGTKINGTISLQLNTQIEIFQNQFLSKTDLSSYKWVDKPVIKVLGLNIPIEPIANYVIKRYKTNLCETIDESIQSNFNIESARNSISHFFRNPLYISDDQQIQVFANPIELALGPMSMTARELIIPVLFYFESVITQSTDIPTKSNTQFSIRPFFDTTSEFYIQAKLPMGYLEQMLKIQTEQQEFGSGMSQVRVNKINLLGFYKTMVIPMELTGSYRGKMELSFDPVYDKEDKIIKLQHFKLKIVSGPKMKKIIFSLVKGIAEQKLKNEIERQINLTVKDYETNLNQLLSGTEVQKGIFINGQVFQYEIKDLLFYKEKMYFTIHSKLTMNADIKYIDKSKLILDKP